MYLKRMISDHIISFCKKSNQIKSNAITSNHIQSNQISSNQIRAKDVEWFQMNMSHWLPRWVHAYIPFNAVMWTACATSTKHYWHYLFEFAYWNENGKLQSIVNSTIWFRVCKEAAGDPQPFQMNHQASTLNRAFMWVTWFHVTDMPTEQFSAVSICACHPCALAMNMQPGRIGNNARSSLMVFRFNSVHHPEWYPRRLRLAKHAPHRS